MSYFPWVPTIAARWASCALFLFDISITLDKEIALVWNFRWTIPKCLYLLIRYLGLAMTIFGCAVSFSAQSEQFCAIYNTFNTTWLLISVAAADALLMLRVLALLKDRPRLSVALKSLYGVIYCIEFALLCYDLDHSLMPAAFSPNLGCTALYTIQSKPTTSEIVLPIATAPVLLFNVILLALVLFKISPQYRPASDVSTPLLTLFVRDGAIYFMTVCCFLVFVTATPLAFWKQPTMSMMGLPPFLAISPIVSCRLFLNLRDKATAPRQPPAPSSQVNTGPSTIPSTIYITQEEAVPIPQQDLEEADADLRPYLREQAIGRAW